MQYLNLQVITCKLLKITAISNTYEYTIGMAVTSGKPN
jgi:hypothetical protein